MPNIWTHILFVDQLCVDLKRTDLLKTSSATLHMGAQGPDPFFYHNYLPFHPDQNISDIGMALHTESCGEFLLNMIQKGLDEKNTIQAYILGFVSHHVLDRHTHPYIHYHAGYVENKHQELEVLLDTEMLKRKRQQKTWKTPVHKEIRITKQQSRKISSLLKPLIAIHYPEKSEVANKEVIEKSLCHIQSAQRVLYDPWRWKNSLFGSLVSSYSHQPIKKSRDYLNESRGEWRHSATHELRTDSFLDLYEKALIEGRKLFQYILIYWAFQDVETLSNIEKLVGNISYDTGEPLEKSLDNRYSRPIV